MRTKVNLQLLLLSFLLLTFGAAAIQFLRPPAYGRVFGETVGNSGFFTLAIGLALVVCGIWTFFTYHYGRKARNSRSSVLPVLIAGLLIALIVMTRWAEKNWSILELIEQAARFVTPWLLLGALRRTSSSADSAHLLHGAARVALALTFIGHGLYALGWPSPTPASFLELVKNCTGLENAAARNLLMVAGLLDLLAAVAIFINPTRRAGLLYMLVWGLLTTIARPWAGFDSAAAGASLMEWLPEALVRAPHFLLPLFLLAGTRSMVGGGRLDISRM